MRSLHFRVPSKDVRRVVLAAVARDGEVSTGHVVAATGLSRQAIHKHLQRMVASGELFREGAGRGARYVAKRTHVHLRKRPKGLDEAALFEEVEEALPDLRALRKSASRILHYVFTEMVNNAIDHSKAKSIEIDVRIRGQFVAVEVADDGIGAFQNVRRALRLGSPLEAIGEISKGKTTTDPERHTGHGVFFSSKAADRFELESAGFRWTIDNHRDDNAIAQAPPRRGTRVRFEVAFDTKRELRKIFDEFTTDFEFDKTRTIVRLFAHGLEFVSRSEAKRLLHGLDRFREVVLDFAGVEQIGQGFADEIFRVWARAHAGTRLEPVNMIEPVAFMVERARHG